MRNLTRRDFIRLAATTLGGVVLAGCKGEQLARMTDTPLPTVAARPTIGASPTVAPTAVPRPTISVSPTAPPPSATPSLAGPADNVFINGKVITMNAIDTVTQAVAIKDGLILQTGTDQVIRAMVGPKTQVIDLRGRTLTPGLIDAHIHPQMIGAFNRFTSFLLPEVKSIQDMQRKLADVVAKTTKGNWILGMTQFQTLTDGRMPNQQDLDPVSSEHPVWIMDQGGHYGVANSMALKISGITVNTPNPTGGIIKHDSKGNPTGVLYNIQAMDLIWKYTPRETSEKLRENVLSPQPLLAAHGVTSFYDNYVRPVDTVRAYLEVGRQGKMLLRGGIYYSLERPDDLDGALQIEHYADEFLRFAGFKFIMDGQMPIAYCHEPHNGVSWNMPTWDPKTFKKTVRTLHDTGLQICVHCLGDAAVDLALDAYEEAMKANPRPDPRHRIEHCVFSTPEATKRIKDLGVVVCPTPTFIRYGGDYWRTLFDDRRLERAMVTREWLEAGIHVAMGADAPCTPWYAPQVTLWAAVTRATYSGKVLNAKQRMSIQEALRTHTIGNAYAAFEEKVKGSIEVGKLADLTVWNEDPYAAVDHIGVVTIAMTIVGGKAVYQG